MGKRTTAEERETARVLAARTLSEGLRVKDIADIAYTSGLFPKRTWKAIQVMICQERQKIDPQVKRKKADLPPATITTDDLAVIDTEKQCSIFDRVELDKQNRVIAVRALRILASAINEIVTLMEAE